MNLYYRALACFMIGFIAKAYAVDEYSPANFFEGEKSFKNEIRFPNIKEDISVTILCNAEVTNTGRFKSNHCYFNRMDEKSRFKKAIVKTTKRSRKYFTPAIVNGIEKNVYLQYSVNFVKNGEDKQINVYPNHGFEVKEYGSEYTSAQRYEKGTHWTFSRCSKNTTVWIKSEINTEGIPQNAEVLRGTGSDLCKEIVSESFLKGQFIPGTANGKPVRSMYIELFRKL